jgi:hypothetical protein
VYRQYRDVRNYIKVVCRVLVETCFPWFCYYVSFLCPPPLLLCSFSFKVIMHFSFGIAHSFAFFSLCVYLFLSYLQIPSFISLFCHLCFAIPFSFSLSLTGIHLLSVVSVKMLWQWWTSELHNNCLLCSATVSAHSDQYAGWSRLIHVQLCRVVFPVGVDAPKSLWLV